MAGRGCTIEIRIHRSTSSSATNSVNTTGNNLGTGTNTTGDTGSDLEQNWNVIHLPVALHSPLLVLKEQLELISQISVQRQILILLDLTDPDRNSDVLLDNRDSYSLRDIGIRQKSVLTLHSLGGTNLSETRVNTITKNEKVHEKMHIIATRVNAAKADHSFNGVILISHRKVIMR